jgi:hypothetical protein
MACLGNGEGKVGLLESALEQQEVAGCQDDQSIMGHRDNAHVSIMTRSPYILCSLPVF